MPRKFAHVPPNPANPQSPVAVVDAVRYITAQSQPAITALPTTATNAQIVAKINELIARLQGE